MSEDKLKKLKDAAVPRASTSAKSKALAAALAAFEEGAEESLGSAGGPADVSAKGNVVELSQTHMTSKSPRRNMMRYSRSTYAIAASVAVVAVSVPVTMHYLRSYPREVFQEIEMGLAARGDGASMTASRDADKKNRGRFAMFDKKPDKNAAPPAGHAAPSPKPATVVAKSDKDRRNAAKAPVGDTIYRPKPDVSGTATEQLLRMLKKTRPVMADGRVQKRSGERISKAELEKARQAYRRIVSRLKESPRSWKYAHAPKGQTMEMFGPAANLRGVDALGSGGRIATLQRPDAVKPSPPAYEGRDKFEAVALSPIKSVASHPVSTFSVDVDTASYSFMRRALNAGRLPQKNAVRIEELINYFAYDYALPDSAKAPFAPSVSVVPSPWSPQNKLVHIAIKGYALQAKERPRANLVFLIDVSGSMRGPDRLPLLKNSFRMLLDNLKPDDTVGIVTYASRPGVALAPTKVSDKAKIAAAIDGLGAGGSTAGAGGIAQAYALAEAGFDKKAVNRIILATDGDFNVGISDRNELKSYIERKRKSGIFLSVLGVGRGNYNDALMQALAQNGNGTAAYIDTLGEARKVLVEEASSTLFPIAKDVKIQIEFNPAKVSHYRLIGYETRALKREDFNNDKVDAGDVGSGHAVTAIYEITPAGAEAKIVDDLRYARPAKKPAALKPDRGAGATAEFGFLKLRYKLPKEDKSRLITLPITPALEADGLQSAARDVRFSTAVAAFGQLLRGGQHMRGFGYDDVIALANGAKGADPFGTRAEFVNLVRLAKSARP